MSRLTARLAAAALTVPCDAALAAAEASAEHWHGRFMVVGWTILLPLGILVARFFKVAPSQDWPCELDNVFWWRSHLWLQSVGVVLVLMGFALVVQFASSGTDSAASAHRWLGRVVVALAALQVVGGMLRGTKGGPADPDASGMPRGDHYDMTRRRIIFEVLHKSVGYVALLLALPTTLIGLRIAQAPIWMWLLITAWWGGLVVAFVCLQRQGRCVDTYQAIWGPGTQHPGNLRRPIGFGARRIDLS